MHFVGSFRDRRNMLPARLIPLRFFGVREVGHDSGGSKWSQFAWKCNGLRGLIGIIYRRRLQLPCETNEVLVRISDSSRLLILRNALSAAIGAPADS